MKRVLVVAYYFPPMGLSGVQRITKFVKYLPDFGWAPTVLTVEPGGYFAFDTSLERDIDRPEITVVRTETFDPTKIFRKKSTVALPAESSRKWMSRISQALFIPDNKIGWLRPATLQGIKLHRETPFDAIFATVPPYTAALIAQKIAAKINVPYVVDYRDDWLDNPRHEYVTPLHRAIHRHLEKRALSKASKIISINKRIAERIKQRIISYSDEKSFSEVDILTQGFDSSDFSDKTLITNADTLTITYSGVFYDQQTPDYFLMALSRFLTRNPEARAKIKVQFVGLVPDSSKLLAQNLGLEGTIRYAGYLPHEKVIDELLQSDVLWMTVGKGKGQELISTSKLFEYFGVQKPVLGLVPEGAAKDALGMYKANWVADPDDIEGICMKLEQIYNAWQKGAFPEPDLNFVKRLDRRYLTKKLSDILLEITSGKEMK